MLFETRYLVLSALLLPLAACGGGESASSAAIVTLTPQSSAVPTATPTPVSTPVFVEPTTTASSTAELQKLLEAARGGEIIYLTPGRYDPVSFQGLRFDVPITLTSADASMRAELTGANLRDCKGIRITNVRLVDHSPETLYDFLVQDAEDIAFDNIVISSVEGATAYQSGPLMIRSSKNVTVIRSEITNVRYGISLLDNQGITITSNYFHDIRTDGVRGGGNSSVGIKDNLFTNFSPSGGDHPDAIQFWTTNTTTSVSDITITDNVIVRGEGAPVQGIFMRDESSTLPYQSVTIEGNVAIGTMYHGISVGNASGLIVSGNRVTGMADQKSWISVPAGATLSSNYAQVFIIAGTNSPDLSGNYVIPASTDNGSARSLEWLANHSR